MAQAHHRKKNPEQVRIQLIESARRLALENGLAAVSLDAIASDAGVTKGGLFYHFPNKQSLIEAVFQYLLQEFQADLEARMSADSEHYGRFTRAYVLSVFDGGVEAQWAPLWVATLTDQDLRRMWGEWFNAQLSQYGETHLQLENARFAADGIWLGRMFGVTLQDPDAFQRYLVDMTRPEK
jgi:AcrR family transcriptional regulator